MHAPKGGIENDYDNGWDDIGNFVI